MKAPLWFALLTGLFVSCGSSPLGDGFRLRLPVPPSLWEAILGAPHWRVEWYDSGGTLRETRIADPALVIDPPMEWPSAVLAWPCWPDRDLPPGLFYPAGAIFPFDAAGDLITLSWEGGPGAVFYRELRRAAESEGTHTGAPRRSEYFDWPRFRALLQEEAPVELRADPWLADWKNIAGQTVRSGFRKTLLKAAPRTGTPVLLPHDGPWLGASPFAPPCLWETGEEVLLPLASWPETWVCPGGVLTLSAPAAYPPLQLWHPFLAPE